MALKKSLVKKATEKLVDMDQTDNSLMIEGLETLQGSDMLRLFCMSATLRRLVRESERGAVF